MGHRTHQLSRVTNEKMQVIGFCFAHDSLGWDDTFKENCGEKMRRVPFEYMKLHDVLSSFIRSPTQGTL